MRNTLEIIMYLASFGVFSAILGLVWKYVRVDVKSTKLRQVGDYALQAVQYAEQIAGKETGQAQKQVATTFIGDLLKKAKLDGLVSAEQVDAELELALLKLKELGGGK